MHDGWKQITQTDFDSVHVRRPGYENMDEKEMRVSSTKGRQEQGQGQKNDGDQVKRDCTFLLKGQWWVVMDD